MSKLKVGVIGLGAMGRNHVRVYSELDCQLVGVVDSNPAVAKEIGEKYRTPFSADHAELLGKVDAVSIAVPTTLHFNVAKDFLKAGVHCLVEKPIASNLNEATGMIELAQSNRVNLAIGHIERFNPAVIALKEAIVAGRLGEILTISTRRVGPAVPRIRDVGIVLDSATHDIGVIRYLVDRELVSVFSRVGQLKHANEDYAIIVLDFKGPTACVETNWFTPHKVRTLVATGSQGIAYLDYIEQKLVIHDSAGPAESPVVKTEPLKIELQEFLRSIAGHERPAVDGIEAREILKIALESNHNNYYHPLDPGPEGREAGVSAQAKKLSVAVAIPCFNTESTIEAVVKKVRSHTEQVIVVDDGSSDRTSAVAKSAGAVVVRHEKNRGYGQSIRSSLAAALRTGADVIITLDGDGQHDPDEIPPLLEPISRGCAQVVIGSRFMAGSGAIPFYRKIGINIINFLWNFGAKTRLTDSQSGFRAYRKEVMKDLVLSENGMSISIEIIERLRRRGVTIAEVPIVCSYDNNNTRLSAKAIVHGMKVAIAVIRIRIRYRSLNQGAENPAVSVPAGRKV